MKKILTFIFLAIILFSVNFTTAAGTCSGTPSICSTYNSNQTKCTSSGCSYNIPQSKCVGTPNACSTYSSQSNCELFGCAWTTTEAGGTTTTTIITGSGGIQTINIFPRAPSTGEIIYSEIVELRAEVFYAEELTNYAQVTANSSMFGEVYLKREANFTDGIYIAYVTINDTEYGNKRITFTASMLGQYDETSVVVELKPSLGIDMNLSEAYPKDSLIKFDGTISDKNKILKNNTLVKISGYQGENKIFYRETYTDSQGKFYSEYLIKYGDPEGNCEVFIEAESQEKEFGSKSLSTRITVPLGIEYYSVNFLSPLKDKTFRRGEVIPITIEVKEKDEFIIGASVIVYTPSGESTTLSEVGDGKYSGSYLIKSNDQIDNWFLSAEAKKEINNALKVGGANLPLTIGPAEIKFEFLSPGSDTVYTNSRLNLKIKLTYADGSLVKGAELNAVLSNTNEIILLKETSNGIYEGNYFINPESDNSLIIKFEVKDIHENFGDLNKVFYVRERSFVGNIFALIIDGIKQFWWEIMIGLIIVGLFFKPKFEISWIKRRIKKAVEEQNKIKAMQIETEKKYYKEGAITKKDFREIIEKYEERNSKAKEDEKVYIKKLNEKLKKNKK